MSSKHYFTVGLHELDDGPKHLMGPLPNDWLARMLHDTDVAPAGETDGSLDLTLTKNGTQVLVRGKLKTVISLPCARTLDPAVYAIEPEVFLLLSPSSSSSVTSGRPSPRRESGDSNKTTKVTERKKKKGTGRGGGWENDPELDDPQAATDTYSGDHIVLDDFLREFVLLEAPMVPLRQDLRNTPFEANPPLPGSWQEGASQAGAPDASGNASDSKPIDPRLFPLAALKAKLENKE